MALPRPPISLSTPIPNQPFSAPEVYYLEGNQGHLPLGSGLYIDPATGDFTNVEPSPYIYCVPQYGNLPVTYPPYGCNTEVNTAGVTDFTDAWSCSYITTFPCVNTSSGVNFSSSWSSLTNLIYFPKLDLSQGEDFSYTWNYCVNLTSFPLVNVSKGVNFTSSWEGCTGLTSFPKLDVSHGEIFVRTWWLCSELTSFPPLDFTLAQTFGETWRDCTSLTSFPARVFDNCFATDFSGAWQNCALSQQSVDNILVSLDTAGQSNGIVNIDGGTSSPPGAAGLAAKASLQGKGWTVTTN